MLCQLSMFGLQVIWPGAVCLTVARRDAFVRQWASEALNLQLIWLGIFAVLSVATVRTQSAILWVLDVAAFALIGLYAAVCGVVGARKAWRGQLWRYPISIRMINRH
jgi:hypothetical protein